MDEISFFSFFYTPAVPATVLIKHLQGTGEREPGENGMKQQR